MKYVLLFGAIAGAIAVTLVTASIILKVPEGGHSLLFGYAAMLASLTLIYIGVKRYRAEECGGTISFPRAFAMGASMALVAGLAYALGWELYTGLTGWNFMADYSSSTMEAMRRDGASAAALQAKATELSEFAAQYRNPLFRIPMIFAEIFPVGLAVALISAILLRKPRRPAAVA